ncbi:MAG: SpoIID/LytB domain-containing protein [Actinomycetota bacterium]
MTRRGMRRLAVCALAGALIAALVPAGAQAKRTVTIRGRGWGHGIGMSQYGAYGRALKGRGARQILTHYYSGAHVRKARMPRRVRVGLLQSRGAIHVTSQARTGTGGRVVFKVKGGGVVAAGGVNASWRVEPSVTGGMRLFRNGVRVKRRGRIVFGGLERPLVATFARYGSRARITEKSLAYAYGKLQVAPYPTGSCGLSYCLRLVLALPMQKYVYGLGEVPASWPHAALRAQAIAARTYALRRILADGQHREPCDCALYDSALDQVYSGDAKRTGSGSYWKDWKSSVDKTRSKVVLYEGSPIQALYSSSSGGHTEAVQNVWGGDPVPYLRGVRDGADAVAANPNYRWRVTMPWSTLAAKLDAAFGVGPTLKRVKLVRPFGVSGRVTVVKSTDRGGVRVVGSAATARVSGWSVRSALGLKDTWFRLRVHISVAAALEPGYEAAGGATGPLGRATSGPRRTAAGGWVQRFEGGSLYRSPDAPAPVALWGDIDERYRELGGPGSPCGFPTSVPRTRGDGLEASFENGTIEGLETLCTRRLRR